MNTKKHVAAYARVSLDSERLEHSLEAQIEKYTQTIEKQPGWVLVKVFYDNGITGTKANRPGFLKLLEACEMGEIDIILVKSISRLSRNSLDLLTTVRHLKDLGVDVWFEKENIHTMDSDGELFLTLLTSFAQEESRSISENVKWSKQVGYESGKHSVTRIYGYTIKDREFTVVPEEATVIKFIFNEYCNGASTTMIASELQKRNIQTRAGTEFASSQISRILRQEAYTGDILQQKLMTESFLTHKNIPNDGSKPMYLIEDHHEAIISKEQFEQAQSILAHQKAHHLRSGKAPSCFTKKLICTYCGYRYCETTERNKTIWLDPGRCKKKNGSYICQHGHRIADSDLRKAITDALGWYEFDEQQFLNTVESIYVSGHTDLKIQLKDGYTVNSYIAPGRKHDRGKTNQKN